MGRSKIVRNSAYLLQPGRGEKRWAGKTSTYFLATGGTTNGAFCLVDETAGKGETVPLHKHARDVESFYVLEGEVTFFFDDQQGVTASAGAFVHLPEGTIHGFRVESETARYLILTTPRHGEFYRAISLPAEADGGPPAQRATDEMIAGAAREYDIDIIGDLP